MPHAPIDFGFDDHPKYAKLSAAHMGLLACAIVYANRHTTDGVIPANWPHRRFGASGSQLARSLVALKVLSVRTDGDFYIEGYLAHNWSKAEIEQKKAQKREAGRLGGQASAAARAQATVEQAGDLNINVNGNPPTPLQQVPPGTGEIPKHMVAVQRTFWISAYERSVTDERGGEPWSFPQKAFSALVSVIQTHCCGRDRLDIQRWLERDVRAFVRALRAIGAEPSRWASYGPDGLQRWHNEQRPGYEPEDASSGVRLARAPIAPLEPYPMTAEEAAAAAEAAMAELAGGGNG